LTISNALICIGHVRASRNLLLDRENGLDHNFAHEPVPPLRLNHSEATMEILARAAGRFVSKWDCTPNPTNKRGGARMTSLSFNYRFGLVFTQDSDPARLT
jgi:hypothetical protein